MKKGKKQDLNSLKSKYKATDDKLVTFYRNNWYDCVNFQLCDAAKEIESYKDKNGEDITHIYSYNKIMSIEDHEGIAKILNRTNFKVLAWFLTPKESE